MLVTNLNTNEIKNHLAVEREFQKVKSGDYRSEFALIGESPSSPFRLIVSHQETGIGLARRCRSMTRFDKTAVSVWDGTRFVKDSCYLIVDRSLGDQNDDSTPKELLACLGSFMYTLGGTTTFLYDGTGTGAANMLSRGV